MAALTRSRSLLRNANPDATGWRARVRYEARRDSRERPACRLPVPGADSGRAPTTATTACSTSESEAAGCSARSMQWNAAMSATAICYFPLEPSRFRPFLEGGPFAARHWRDAIEMSDPYTGAHQLALQGGGPAARTVPVTLCIDDVQLTAE